MKFISLLANNETRQRYFTLLKMIVFPKKEYAQSRTIVKLATGGDDKQVRLLPDDQWIINYAFKEYKTKQSVKTAVHNIIKPLAYGVGGVALISLGAGLGITAAALGSPFMAISLLMGSTALTIGGGLMAPQLLKDFKKSVTHFQTYTLNEIRNRAIIAYTKHKGGEVSKKLQNDLMSSFGKIRGKKKKEPAPMPSDTATPVPSQPEQEVKDNITTPKLRTRLNGAFSIAKKKIKKQAQKRKILQKNKNATPEPK